MKISQGFKGACMKKAFSVLELVFVIIILGILMSLALPKFNLSKDEAELSKALNNLKILINDINIYSVKNGGLSELRTMSNVSEVENFDLSNLSGMKELGFKVANEDNCVSLIFIEKDEAILLGISSNQASKDAITKIANGTKIDLDKIDFTSTSKNKSCVAFSKSENFKNLASKTYILGNF